MSRGIVWMIGVAACGVEPSADPAVGVVTAAFGDGCPITGCSDNAATVDRRLFFHELSACGGPNAAGVGLVELRGRDGVRRTVRVVGDELRGEPLPLSLAPPLVGAQLVGATLVVESVATTPASRVEVTIAAVGSTDYWVSPGPPVPTYVFTWRPAPQPGDGTTLHPPEPMCGASPDNLSPEWKIHAGDDATPALVFAGDRYDPDHKTVAITDGATSPSACWFNVACAGSASAKMHLLRHTTAGSDADHVTTQPQRQAMLKLLTDDVCGTGESFTVTGEHVYYEDARQWHPLAGAPVSVEAVWNDRGAMCLGEPRRQREDPSVLARITTACAAAGHRLGACPVTAADVDRWPGLAATGRFGYGLSANPP